MLKVKMLKKKCFGCCGDLIVSYGLMTHKTWRNKNIQEILATKNI